MLQKIDTFEFNLQRLKKFGISKNFIINDDYFVVEHKKKKHFFISIKLKIFLNI